MSELIISVSGLRGIVGQSLTPLVASRYVAAFAHQLRSAKESATHTTSSTGSGAEVAQHPSHATSRTVRPKVIVGRDGRATGAMLQRAVIATLQACGCDVLVADVIATPTIGVLVRDQAADGAIQITASHNPPPYNGIKLFGLSGRVINATAGQAIKQSYERGDVAWQPHDHLGTAHDVVDAHTPHMSAVLATVDVDRIRSKKYRVLLDSNHGAGGVLGRVLLERLGCEVHHVGATPDGLFEHVPEPTAENLVGVSSQVTDHRCVIGFCQDPDADRLALIDETGRYVGEEYTLALCVQRALTQHAKLDQRLGHASSCGPIVINGATSGMSERLAKAAGVDAYRSAVGEANVADMMIQREAIYGGEGNGGPIDPRVGYVRDSFVGMAQVLALMAETGKPLSELVDAMPRLAIHKAKADLSGISLGVCLDRVAAHFENDSTTTIDRGDGLRIAWPDKWLLVRGSNTEPIVRFIAEAESEAEAKRLCDVAASLARPSGIEMTLTEARSHEDWPAKAGTPARESIQIRIV